MLRSKPSLQDWRKDHATNQRKKANKTFAAAVGSALRRADKAARKTARTHSTRLYLWQDGKIVSKKP